MRIHKLALAAAFALATPAFAAATHWDIDPAHSNASFSVKHMMVSTVRGELGKVTGKIVLDKDDPSKSSVEATIDVKAINTRDEKRDAHLRSADFFDVEKYPTITFKSSKVEKDGDKYKVSGDLTMRGVTKPVTLQVEGPTAEQQAWGKTMTGFTATTKLNRKDFGVNWSKSLDNGGAVVSDDVSVQLDIEADKAEGASAQAPSTAKKEASGSKTEKVPSKGASK